MMHTVQCARDSLRLCYLQLQSHCHPDQDTENEANMSLDSFYKLLLVQQNLLK